VDGAGFLAAASAECPMSTTFLPVWLKDPFLFPCAAAADAGLWCCKTGLRGSSSSVQINRSSAQEEDRIIVAVAVAVKWGRTLR
jgi:hypothetical protein